LNANGGTPGYKFSINGGTYSVSNSFSNLSAGSYLISAKDSNNCTHDTTISITQPSSLAANVNITSPLCFGDANGSYAVMASGGTTPYSYANGAGPFSNNNNFSALTAGTYVAHIKDNNNCTHDTTITITQPSEVAISFIFTNAKCFGDANGTITINGNGGTPTYTYSYNSNPYQANNQVNNLIAGNYTISVKDAHGCKHDSTLTITQPTPLHLTNLQIVNPTCDGYTDGSVSFAGIGGTTPYLYNINNGNYSSLNVFQSLGQGSYQLTVKDSNNCTHDTTVNLVGYPPIYVDSATITPASCFGVNDGTLTVHASGGNAPLKYALNSGLPGLSNFFTGLAATNYSIKVVDNTGCEKDSSIFIPSPVVMDLSFVIANNDCVGTDDAGAIGVHVSGGNAPYAYLWNNAATTDSIFGLNNGHYFVVVTDAKGCIDTGFADINYGDCCTVFVPTAFTPNNDNKNDKIGVLFKGDMVMKEFSIFNRFGQRVFFSQNVSDKWDGNFNGVAQEIGTYFYFIKAVCGYQQNMDKLFKGDFTLIR
jgi:gliding motility-associated-like protein